jgi:hypothetical protein
LAALAAELSWFLASTTGWRQTSQAGSWASCRAEDGAEVREGVVFQKVDLGKFMRRFARKS